MCKDYHLKLQDGDGYGFGTTDDGLFGFGFYSNQITSSGEPTGCGMPFLTRFFLGGYRNLDLYPVGSTEVQNWSANLYTGEWCSAWDQGISTYDVDYTYCPGCTGTDSTTVCPIAGVHIITSGRPYANTVTVDTNILGSRLSKN